MRRSPQVIAIDDEPDHLAGLANSLNRRGVPCFQIPFTEEGQADIEPCPDVLVIFADLHLGGGALAGDHRTDFSAIGALLEGQIKPSRNYLILLWTIYPDQAPNLRRFLDERLRGVRKPEGVVPLNKVKHLDVSSGRVRDERALINEIAAGSMKLPEAGALFKETASEAVERYRPTPEGITDRLHRLFQEAEGPRGDAVPPGFPEHDTAMEDWLHVELPDFSQTPRQMLDSGDDGTLFLLDRFVNAIATSRALSHPHIVRDIVRHRLETQFREASASDNELEDRFEQWLDAPNPMFGDEPPRQFFDAREVDATRLRKISSLLDSLDDGTFS